MVRLTTEEKGKKGGGGGRTSSIELIIDNLPTRRIFLDIKVFRGDIGSKDNILNGIVIRLILGVATSNGLTLFLLFY